MTKKKAASKKSRKKKDPMPEEKHSPKEVAEPAVGQDRSKEQAGASSRSSDKHAELGSVAVSFEGVKPSAEVMSATSEDFRESLQTLHGVLELLISGKVPDEHRFEKFMGIAYRETQYLSNRANDLQVASMIEAGRMNLRLTPLDLGALLNEIVQRLTPENGDDGATLKLESMPELPALRGDESLMRMLLSNLIERCRKTAPEKGWVQIEVELQDDQVMVNMVGRGKAEPKYTILRLADASERGLSLYVADRIAYAHEGELQVMGADSEIKALRLTLPLQVKGRGRGKILVVDDNPQAATLLEYALEEEGYEALKAMNGLEGLKLARTERVDLVILDILLPGIDGFEVCHQLRADPKTASMPVIMVSAKAREEDRATALRIGADAYFGKPLGMAELMSAVQNLLEEHQPEDWSPA